jgi:hypothetical protein
MNSEFKNSPFITDIISQFDSTCKDQFYCDLKFNLNLLTGACQTHLLNEVSKNRNVDLQFQLITLCKAERDVKLLWTNTTINRESIHMIAIYTEILSICIFIIYMSVLDEY